MNEGLFWIEKYRPHQLVDIKHQEHVISLLTTMIQSSARSMPHLLFYGPPGTGKTSSVLAMCTALYGSYIANYVLELNAAIDRGIDVIRTVVKPFCQRHVQCPAGTPKQYRGLPKLVILDEADYLTVDAQNALRRIMEKSTVSTRFCLLCNSLTRINDSLISRCTPCRFAPLPRLVMANQLQEIAALEHMTFDSDDTLCQLIDVTYGDMRHAISLLHAVSFLVVGDPVKPVETGTVKETSIDRKIPNQKTSEAAVITTPHIQQVAGQIDSLELANVLNAIDSMQVSRMQEAAQQCLNQGYPASQLLVQLVTLVLIQSKWTDAQKARICVRIAEADHKLTLGANDYLQLVDVLSFASLV